MMRPLRDNLSYRLSMVGFLMGRSTSQLYAEHGLTVHQWKVLSVVFHHAPMPAVEIERWVTLDKAAISRAVAQLLRLGLVERRLRAGDGRKADILLTDGGRVVSERISAATAVLQDSLMQTLPPGEQRRFFEALDAVEAALRRAEASAVAPRGRPEPPSSRSSDGRPAGAAPRVRPARRAEP